jgi:type IV secretory pathway VirB4 component
MIALTSFIMYLALLPPSDLANLGQFLLSFSSVILFPFLYWFWSSEKKSVIREIKGYIADADAIINDTILGLDRRVSLLNTEFNVIQNSLSHNRSILSTFKKIVSENLKTLELANDASKDEIQSLRLTFGYHIQQLEIFVEQIETYLEKEGDYKVRPKLDFNKTL